MADTEKHDFDKTLGSTITDAPLLRLDADGFPLPLVDPTMTDVMSTPPSLRRRRGSRPPNLELTPSSEAGASAEAVLSASSPKTARSSIGRGLPSDFMGRGMRSDVERDGTQEMTLDRWREHRRVVTDSASPMRDTASLVPSRTDDSATGSRAVSYGYQYRDQHRPLPAPPSTTSADRDFTPRTGGQSSVASLEHRTSFLHTRTPARKQGTMASRESSIGISASSSSSSSRLISPATPGVPDPRRLDREGLIGVGELATTPRFTTHVSTSWNISGTDGASRGTTSNAERYAPPHEADHEIRTSRTEVMRDEPARALPPSRSLDVVTPGSRRERQVSGPRVRSGANTQQQRGEETYRRGSGVPRLPSFGDLGGSFKVPTPTSAATVPHSSSSSRSSSPPFAPRPQQHRQPPPTTPSSTTTPSAHSILRQFGSTRDFSHLPPSPSSASIGKIMMKESASMGNLPVMSTGGGEYASRQKEWRTPYLAGSPKKASKGTAAGSIEQGETTFGSHLDEETREVIRRLDGLGKSSSGSLKRLQDERGSSSTNSGSIGLGYNSPAAERTSAFPANLNTSANTDSRGTKRAYTTDSGSPFSPATTTTSKSHASTSSDISKASSREDGSTHEQQSHLRSSARGSSTMTATTAVPPVPPVPMLFQQASSSRPVQDSATRGKGVVRSTTMNDFGKTVVYYEPVRDTSDPAAISPSYLTVPFVHEGRLTNSASSPTLTTDAELGMAPDKSPVLSVTSADSFDLLAAQGSTALAATGRPRMMHKKWSFSSALNLVSSGSKQKLASSSSEILSPGLPPSSSLTSNSTLDAAMTPPLVSASPLSSPMDLDSLAPPPLSHRSSSTSESGSTARAPLPMSAVRTVVDQDGFVVPPSVNATRRGTGPSLPFFRRSSSSSFQAPTTITRQSASGNTAGQEQPPLRHEKSATSISGPGSQQRKTVLGIGIPSLLGGSKRNSITQEAVITEQLEIPYTRDGTGARVQHERKGSFGWSGRKRGKTLSSPIEPHNLADNSTPRSTALTKKPLFAHDSSKDDIKYTSHSLASQRSALGHIASHSNLPSSHSSMLPPVLGSPNRATPARQPYQSSSYPITSATPTRIPRISAKVLSTPTPRSTATTPVTKKTVNSRTIPVANDRQAGTLRQPSNGVLVDSSTLGDKVRPPVTRSANQELVQDLPRTEDSDHVDSKLKLPGSRHASSSSFSSVKRALPEPPVHSSDSPGNEMSSLASRRTTSVAVASDGSDSNQGSRSAARLALPSATDRLSSTSGYSSMSNLSRPGSSRAALSRSGSPANIMVDEDEVLGDEEMAAFFKRQRSRQAKGEKMAAELEALLNFPDPANPVEAMTPHAFIKKHFDTLSLYERREILDYSAIWFSGSKSSKKAATPDSSQNNYGYDDERGDYLVNFGDHLAYRYEILGLLGKGSFGQVIQCRDHKTGDCVAVKIIRNKKRFHQQALVEVRILENLVQWDPEDKHNLIKIVEKFSFRSHLCIVTELLSLNLYELVKANNFVGFSTALIRRFTIQMLSALQVMRNNRIIHCDLKPENILLRHPAKSGIKIIDFGSSCHEDERVYTYIQSRFYRSPEIILGMKYNVAIDMWSLGCILAEMHTGFPIFPGENEQEQLACIMELLGVPERHLLEKGERKRSFFDSHGQPRPVTNSKGKRRRPGSKTLAAVLKSDDPLFVDFITKCLIWDPERRLKPSNAMHHPWILASKKIKAAHQSPASSIPSTPRVLGPSRQYSVIEDTIIKKKGNNNNNGIVANGALSSSRSSLLGSGETTVKSPANRSLHQDMMKARISKPMSKEISGGSISRETSSLASLTYENDPLQSKTPRLRQLTGKSYKTRA